MPRDPFDGLRAFLLVAEHKSFTKAARELGVSAAAVSQTIRALENRLRLPLLQRTTRQVGLTEAGIAFYARLRPAAGEIVDAIEALNTFRDRPAGHLRLTVPRIALPLVIEPILPRFRRAYPEVSVEIAVEDATVDLAAKGFDAGIRIGEFIERDMVAVRLTPDITWSVLGAPDYFSAHGRPRTPDELMQHECILYRFPRSGAIHRWEFVRARREFAVNVPGKVVTSDSLLLISLARGGIGLTYSADLVAAEDVSAGRLERVLKEFLPRRPGLFVYFPSRMQTQPKLRAFIDLAVARLRMHSKPTPYDGS
jgi:DNA-binding transcriptional LysR family regulator